MKRFVRYQNGNYTVTLDTKTGTKIRENDLDFFEASTVESMDIKITNYCDMNCPMCLKGSAKLNVEGSTKAIADIKVGDQVLSYNHTTNSSEYKPVKTLYQRPYKGKMFKITLESGKTISCTPNHGVYTQRGYIRADELKIDDVLLYI